MLKGVVTNRQLFFILVFVLTGYSLITIPRDAIKAAGTGAWFSILLLTIIFAIGVFFIASLNQRFQGKTIFEYSTLLVGKPTAFIICFFYAGYFLFVVVLICRGVAEFIKGSYLPLTPIWAILFLIIFVCLYIANKGITNVGRMCEIYGAVFIVTFLIMDFIMFRMGDVKYIQPFFEVSQVKEYVFGAKDLIIAFLGIEVLTMIPFGAVNNKMGKLYSVIGVIFVGLFYIIAIESSTMIMGINDILNYDNSLVEALREVRLPRTLLLERVDFTFLTVGITGILASLSILYFATIENVTKLTRINRNVLVISIGITTYILSNFFLDNELETFLFGTVVPILGVFTAFLIPITLYLIARVKKL